jgi:CheY-like chemotaxis protein
MTANAMQGDREKCLAAGMNNYIAKPTRMSELQSILESACAHLEHAGNSTVVAERN